jgi:hypothetical protein
VARARGGRRRRLGLRPDRPWRPRPCGQGVVFCDSPPPFPIGHPHPRRASTLLARGLGLDKVESEETAMLKRIHLLLSCGWWPG